MQNMCRYPDTQIPKYPDTNCQIPVKKKTRRDHEPGCGGCGSSRSTNFPSPPPQKVSSDEMCEVSQQSKSKHSSEELGKKSPRKLTS